MKCCHHENDCGNYAELRSIIFVDEDSYNALWCSPCFDREIEAFKKAGPKGQTAIYVEYLAPLVSN